MTATRTDTADLDDSSRPLLLRRVLIPFKEHFMYTSAVTPSQTKPARTRLVAAVLAASAIAMTAGCSTLGADDYRYGDARVEQSVAYGVVESVRPVRVEEDHGAVGTVAGAVLGGVLGNEIGAGLGRAAATVAGAVAGGIGGNALEHGLTRDNGEEVVVRLDNGALVSIVQGGQGLRGGDRVRVLTGPSGSRVERA
jgi:outer membrane lipoprotein SlyB